MNKADLLKKMLPGFLPLLVFIIVDEWLGTEAGILFALCFGLLELVFIYVREKRIEKFVIVDTVFLVVFGGILLLRNKLKIKIFNNEEWLPLVDEDGKVAGKAPRSLCHKDKNLLHPVVHVHFFNEKGDIFLQKRPKNKLTQPGKWDTAVGGHISDGETLEEGLEKEVREEIGVTKAKYQFIKKYVWESDIERELVYLFFAKTEEEIIINKKELDDGQFWSFSEIKKGLGKSIFTPNFEIEFKKEILSFF